MSSTTCGQLRCPCPPCPEGSNNTGNPVRYGDGEVVHSISLARGPALPVSGDLANVKGNHARHLTGIATETGINQANAPNLHPEREKVASGRRTIPWGSFSSIKTRIVFAKPTPQTVVPAFNAVTTNAANVLIAAARGLAHTTTLIPAKGFGNTCDRMSSRAFGGGIPAWKIKPKMTHENLPYYLTRAFSMFAHHVSRRENR